MVGARGDLNQRDQKRRPSKVKRRERVFCIRGSGQHAVLLKKNGFPSNSTR